MGGKDLVGRPASEEEVAKGLGFNSVEEFRRWDTETGKKAAEAEHAARQAKDEADRFRWHGRRMDGGGPQEDTGDARSGGQIAVRGLPHRPI